MAIQPGRGNSKKFDFTYRLPEVLKIYRAGNKQEWDAYSDIPWDRLGRLRLSEEERYAGRWWWSHRAQLEYQGVSFGAAAIAEAVRQHYEFDLRLFLCQLTYEEGRHAEVSAYFADQLGGFIEELPHMGMLEGAAEAAETKLEAREWSLLDEWLKVGIAETISGEMFRQRYLDATDPCAKEVTRRILTDEMRHKSVIWAYLPHKIQQLSLEQKEKLRIDCI